MTLATLLLSLCLAVPPTQHVSAGSLEVEVAAGVVRQLTNRLTGETLTAAPGPLHGAWRQTAPGRCSLLSDATNEFATLTTRFTADGERVVVQQSGRSTAGGLRGVQWGLTVPDTAVLYVPGLSGQRLDREAPVERLELRYPISWECQFVLIQTARGGFLVQATDDAAVFKALHLRHHDGVWEIGCEAQAEGPWATAREAAGTTWWIQAYRGDWSAGAAIYRQWAEQTFRPVPVVAQQPSWVKDLALVVISGLEPLLLEALAKRCPPAQTLIYVPGWRRDGYDRNYPDYTPADGFVEQIRAARARGFRVMLHVNYFGCTPENPAYEALKAYHVRRSWDGQLDYWDWQRSTPPIKFAYLNPAARAWRELFVRKMREVVALTGCDALHLDQTLCIDNDQNGRIDGLNMMQGALALHRELRVALPQVALSGEGLNEITYRDEALAQRHLTGLDHADHRWDLERIAASHAVSSAVLRPYTAIYGYLGHTTPLDTPYWLAWQSGYEHFGVLPTFARANASDAASEQPALQQLWREVGFWATARPQPQFDTWAPEERFVWQTADGRRVAWRTVAGGSELVCGPTVLARRLHGAERVAVAGRVEGAVAWDAAGCFGLDPGENYLWSPTPPAANAVHVAAASRPVQLSGQLDGALGLLRVGDRAAAVDLRAQRTNVEVGVRLRDGAPLWQPGLMLDHPSGGVVQLRSGGLFVHPPWKADGLPSGPVGAEVGLGSTVVRWRLRLPPAPLEFRSEVGLDPGANREQTDGVTFTVSAQPATGAALTASRHVPWGDPQVLRLDLAPLAGQEIALSLESAPGPAGQVSFDWSLWLRPRLEPLPRPVTLTLANRRWLAAVGPAGEVALSGEPQQLTTLPGAVYLLSTPPQAVQAGDDLGKLTASAVLEDDTGRWTAPFGFQQASVGSHSVGHQVRLGWTTHPPNDGRIRTHFALRLPAAPLRLEGFVGLRDGNQSKGALFRIEANGATVWEQAVAGGPGRWQPCLADLRRWAGQLVVLTLVVDSQGDYGFDWACWGDLRLRAAD
ncbi:MAG: hypothetical protein IT204_09310 [Fimbriimonadaceae bacterium]|nr:hypothetical protein [Fimbriimonadaceae bacterium]